MSLGRNNEWQHLNNADVISRPDTWEYPRYLAFHCIPFALVDPEFAKHQLLLLLREWYMHPNGQLPAYEWALGDVSQFREHGQGDPCPWISCTTDLSRRCTGGQAVTVTVPVALLVAPSV